VIEARPLGLTDGLVLTMAGAGVAAAALFVTVESRGQHPMLPLQIFGNKTFSAAVVYGVIGNLTYYGIVFVLSLYLQRVLGYSPFRAGVAFLPLTATFFVVNLLSGWWVGKAGSRSPMIVGALIDASGFAVLLALDRNENLPAMLCAFALLPAGLGLGVPAITSAVLASVHKRMSGVAAGALNASRQAGGAIGVALFGALADGGPAEIVSGLHQSAIVAAALLVLAALIAWRWVRSAGAAGKAA
jgi:MFS transporter, DHA2 family, methylenomycin A resistance protein